ncbi:hypothetical protein TNCV_3212231 [Trichonephila clavipes]|nr:hypothetical protein TNCV_3212231 [Trichonephila clavipes]
MKMDTCHYAHEGIKPQFQMHSNPISLTAFESWYQGLPRVKGFTSMVFMLRDHPFASYLRHALGGSSCSRHVNMLSGCVINEGLFSLRICSGLDHTGNVCI